MQNNITTKHMEDSNTITCQWCRQEVDLEQTDWCDTCDKSIFDDRSDLRRLALFDAVINNTDRKIGHLLPDQNGHLFACDHGVTFHSEDKLRTVLWQWAGDPLLEEERHILDRTLVFVDSYAASLSAHLTDEEIEAMRRRIEKLRSDGIMPLPSEDWPAIPWPAY